jgi:hypothetical protein
MSCELLGFDGGGGGAPMVELFDGVLGLVTPPVFCVTPPVFGLV